jgi:hypothetical protein
MTTGVTSCRGNRYRYYIRSALLHDRSTEAGARARVNADDIERLVIGVLSRELSEPGLATDSGATGWGVHTRTRVRDTIERVIVPADQVQIVRKIAPTSPACVFAALSYKNQKTTADCTSAAALNCSHSSDDLVFSAAVPAPPACQAAAAPPRSVMKSRRRTVTRSSRRR